MSPLPRRDLFRAAGLAAAGGSMAFVAACGDDDDDAGGADRTDTTGTEGDVALLNDVLRLEQAAIAAYGMAAAPLEGEALAAARRFREHEREHAAGLEEAIRELDGAPVRPRTDEEYAQDFPELSSREGALRFAVDLESTAVAAYIDALPKLSTGELRQTAAAILSNEAEHIAVLLGLLGEQQAPDAFVTGEVDR